MNSELKSKNLCHHCVKEVYLSAEIEREGHSKRCSYCGRCGGSYTLGALGDRIEIVIKQFFVRTWDRPQALDRESNKHWIRDGIPVVPAIQVVAQVPEQAARDIQAILEEKHLDPEFPSRGRGDRVLRGQLLRGKKLNERGKWRTFEQSLETETRFFSRKSAALLEFVFSGVDSMSSIDEKPLVVTVGPGELLSAVYRARVFQSGEPLSKALCRPDLHLGPPPSSLVSRLTLFEGAPVTVFDGRVR